jgi:predicted nucleic acid-binding Zn ribbon protein
MGKNFNVEIRTTCKVCSAPITKQRSRTYCSKECRTKAINKKRYQAQRVRQREQNDKRASQPSPDKKKCAICGLWFKKVVSHVWQRHHLTAREYKEFIDAPLRKGILTEDKREYLRSLAEGQGFAEMEKLLGKKLVSKKVTQKQKSKQTKVEYLQNVTIIKSLILHKKT